MRKAGIVLVAVILIVLMLQFDFASFWMSFSTVSVWAFLGLLILQIFSQLLINYQWCRIGKVMGASSGFMKMLYINARGMVIECITPGVKIGGEVTRAFLLKKEMGYSSSEAATLVAIQKMVSLWSFFLINFVALISISNKIPFLQNVWIKVLICVFLILVISFFIGFFFLGRPLKKRLDMVSSNGRWKKKIIEFFSTLLTHVQLLKNAKVELLKQLLLSLFIWILFPLKMVILVSLFTPNYDIVYLAQITFISYMMGMIPLLPGGLGSFEATMGSLLYIMKISTNQAAAITLLFRFNTFWFVIIISLLFIGFWKLRGKSFEQKSIKNLA